MSHIKKIQTKFTDLEVLAEAAIELGLTLETGEELTVRDYYGHSVSVEARISLGRYALGFQRQDDGTFTMAADFWGIGLYAEAPKVKAACAGVAGSVEQISEQTQQRMATLFARPYAVAATRKEVRTNSKYRGFQLSEERNPQGEVVRLTLVQYKGGSHERSEDRNYL